MRTICAGCLPTHPPALLSLLPQRGLLSHLVHFPPPSFSQPHSHAAPAWGSRVQDVCCHVMGPCGSACVSELSACTVCVCDHVWIVGLWVGFKQTMCLFLRVPVLHAVYLSCFVWFSCGFVHVTVFLKNVYLFIWLSCGMQTYSCSIWDLVPWLGIKPGPPALGVQS